MSACPRTHPVRCRRGSRRGATTSPCVQHPSSCDRDNSQLHSRGVAPPYSARPFGASTLRGSAARPPLHRSGNGLDHLFNHFQLLKVLTDEEKGSASESVIAFARHRVTGQRVVLKAYLEYDTSLLHQPGANGDPPPRRPVLQKRVQQHASMAYENRMYEAIEKNVDAVPNLVRWVGHYEEALDAGAVRRMAMSSATSDLERTLLLTLARMDRVRESVAVHVTVTEHRPDTVSMAEALTGSSAQHVAEAVRSYLFQIVFTLAAMHRLGFQHNDLHLRNVLIDRRPPQQVIAYEMDGQVYLVPVHEHGQALVFDWDHGICAQCGPNVKRGRDLCAEFGFCGALNDRYDLYKLLTHLDLSGVPGQDEYMRFRADVMGSTPVYQAAPGHICMRSDDPLRRCRPLRPDEPASVMPAGMAIKHPFFERYRLVGKRQPAARFAVTEPPPQTAPRRSSFDFSIIDPVTQVATPASRTMALGPRSHPTASRFDVYTVDPYQLPAKKAHHLPQSQAAPKRSRFDISIVDSPFPNKPRFDLSVIDPVTQAATPISQASLFAPRKTPRKSRFDISIVDPAPRKSRFDITTIE